MKKALKKLTASLLAVSTLTLSSLCLNVSAVEPRIDGQGTFRVGTSTAYATIYVSSSQANASTSLSGASYVMTKLTVYGDGVTSYSANNGVLIQGTYVSVNAVGSGITRATANFYAEKGTDSGSLNLSRNIVI